MKLHEIKLREEFCDAVLNGEKTFEIRNNDRGYQKGDHIKFNPVDSTGCKIYSTPASDIENKEYEITYVLNGWGLQDGFVALAIRPCGEEHLTDWIPCSERLPEHYDYYLVTMISDNNKRWTTITEFDVAGRWVTQYSDIYVIAWMPLPDPYKGEAHG